MLLLAGCKKEYFTIDGSMSDGGTQNIRAVYVTDYETLQSEWITMTDGQFELKGINYDWTIVYLINNKRDIIARAAVKNGDNITITGSMADPYHTTVEGNDANEEWSHFMTENAELYSDTDRSKLNSAIEKYVESNPDRISSTLLLLNDYAAARGKELVNGIVPSWLARLMTGMACPESGERVRDLASGAGSLLAEAALGRGLAERAYFVADGVCPPLGVLLPHLCGVPVVLENLPKGQAAPGQGATDPSSAFLVTNEGTSHLTLSAAPAFAPMEQGTEELFWICRHVSEALPACGRSVLLTRLGPLFREETEAHMRAQLVRRNLLDAVIQLPSNLVPRNNGAHAILLFDRRREQGGPQAGRDSVFMADLSSWGRRSRTLGYFEEAHIQKTLELLRERREKTGVSRCVPCADILAQNVWLPSRFLLSADGMTGLPDERPVRIAALDKELQETQAQLDAVLARLGTLCPSQPA